MERCSYSSNLGRRHEKTRMRLNDTVVCFEVVDFEHSMKTKPLLAFESVKVGAEPLLKLCRCWKAEAVERTWPHGVGPLFGLHLFTYFTF